MPRASRLTPDRIEAIAAMLRAGVSTKVICRERGISHKTIMRAQRAGVLPPLCPKGRVLREPDLAARINALVDEGVPYNEIGRRVGLQGKTISRWAARGWVKAHSPHVIAANRIAAAIAAHKSPTFKANQSAALRRYWSAPEVRERRAAKLRAERERRSASDAAEAAVVVPSWVPGAFHETYLTLAYQKGEEDAAAVVRRLKRERRVAA